MKKKNRMRNHIIIFVVLILLIEVSLFFNKPLNLELALKDGSILVQKMVIYPFTILNTEKNKTATESYIIQKNVNASLEKEIQELKEVLDLNKTLTEYDTVNSTIVSRNKSYWFNTITIDKGSSSGIKSGQAVITKSGLVGKISDVSKYSSEVKLITSDDINYKVSVSIKTNEVDNYAILNGYDAKTGLVKASGIDKMTEINKGDTVLTSGLGSLFPAGIYIGKVEKIQNDKYNLSKTIYIKTSQNFNDIHYVTILKEKK